MRIAPTRIREAKTVAAINFAITFIEAEETLSGEDVQMISAIRAGVPIGEISEQARMWLFSVAEDVGCYDGISAAGLELLDHLTTALTAR